MRRRLLLFSLLALGCAGYALAQAERDFPGRQHHIRLGDLPPPFDTSSAENPPRLIPPPRGRLPAVPTGFKVRRFARGLGRDTSPRAMAVAPNGDVFTTLSGEHEVVGLRDRNRDGVAESRFTFAARQHGLELPFGLAFRDGWLYVASTNEVVRFAYRPGQKKASGPPETVVAGLPGFGYNQHWTRNLAFSPDGSKLYVSVGSEFNVAEEGPMRAAIHEYEPDGTGRRRYAWGLRNPVGLAFHPTTGVLWTTCNERDDTGDDLVPDFFTSVRDQGFYGWPYFYIGPNPDPRLRGRGAELADDVLTPEVLFQAHSAALGCAFYTGSQFPADYRNDAFIAFHGSWNRRLRTGYKVVRVRFRNGQPDSGYEDFMTGFVTNPERKDVWGRPVAVAVARDGALLVSDDGGNVIWRVAYTGRR